MPIPQLSLSNPEGLSFNQLGSKSRASRILGAFAPAICVKYVTHLTATDSLKRFGKGLGSASPEAGYAWYAGI
jgi:hypothetical protein